MGHLILAEEARSQLGLDAVYFVPAGAPPHKNNHLVTPAEHRLHLVELATAAIDYFGVSRVDVDRPGPHYADDMVQLLQADLGPSAELYFLMGMDSLHDLPPWHNAAGLLTHCRIVALSRPGSTPDWDLLEAALPGICAKVILLEMPLLEISSSDLRHRLQTGQSIRHQVPCAVEAYIRKYGLYQQTATSR